MAERTRGYTGFMDPQAQISAQFSTLAQRVNPSYGQPPPAPAPGTPVGPADRFREGDIAGGLANALGRALTGVQEAGSAVSRAGADYIASPVNNYMAGLRDRLEAGYKGVPLAAVQANYLDPMEGVSQQGTMPRMAEALKPSATAEAKPQAETAAAAAPRRPDLTGIPISQLTQLLQVVPRPAVMKPEQRLYGDTVNRLYAAEADAFRKSIQGGTEADRAAAAKELAKFDQQRRELLALGYKNQLYGLSKDDN